MMIYDWNKISKSDINEINKGKPIFILGSREISESRIVQLARQLSSKKKLLWGVLKDDYILGLDPSPQFKTLNLLFLQNSLKKEENFLESIDIITYFQRDTKFLLRELEFSAVIFVNGSWYRMLHLLPEFWEVINKKLPYKLVSPFINDEEAKQYASNLEEDIAKLGKYDSEKEYTDKEIMLLLDKISKQSYATDDRGASILVSNHKIIATSYNNVVPYETYAMHYGSMKEKNFSPINDLNYYDTNHYEVSMLLKALDLKISLEDYSLYLSLLPCPTCTRMLSKSKIKEIVYQNDHSEGYALKMLEASGKIVRRLVI